MMHEGFETRTAQLPNMSYGTYLQKVKTLYYQDSEFGFGLVK